MSDDHVHLTPCRSDRTHAGPVAVAIVLSALYGLIFLARPVLSEPTWLRHAANYPSRAVYALIDDLLRLVGSDPPTMLRSGLYLFLVAGVVPWVVVALLGRGRPADVGLRRPNRYAWRFLCVGYLISVPFQMWMVRGPGFASPYLREFERAGITAFILYYCVNMLTEHFCLHGVVLGVCRPGHRWPPPAPTGPVHTNLRSGLLRWIGLAQPTTGIVGLRRIIRWIGLPDGCLPALLTSAMLFGLVHLGKNPRELLLSLPGGLVLAYIAYRTNSWLTPFILHLATAGTAFLMILVID